MSVLLKKGIAVGATFLTLVATGLLSACFGGEYETNVHPIEEAFNGIQIKTETAGIEFIFSESDACAVTCYERTDMKHAVSVKEGVLTIELIDEREWYETFYGFSDPKITLSLPRTEYGDLLIDESTGDVEIPSSFKFTSVDITVSTGDVACNASTSGMMKIKTRTGAIRVEGASCGALDCSVSTGSVTLSQISCDGGVSVEVSTGKTDVSDLACSRFDSDGSTGKIALNNVIASGMMFIERSTGDVLFDGCDASEIYVETDTGDVRGSLLSDKVFLVETDTGKIDVPKTTSGGRCEISTDTGDIKITIQS